MKRVQYWYWCKLSVEKHACEKVQVNVDKKNAFKQNYIKHISKRGKAKQK